jgi:hypothetical protein
LESVEVRMLNNEYLLLNCHSLFIPNFSHSTCFEFGKEFRVGKERIGWDLGWPMEEYFIKKITNVKTTVILF